MLFTCLKENLISAVQMVQRAVASKTTMPILTGIHISATNDHQIELQATDYELGIKCTIPANVEKKGSAVLAAKLFGEVVRRLPTNDVTICLEPQDSTVKIKSGFSEYNLLSMPADDFPHVNNIAEDHKVSIKEQELKDFIKKTVFACSQDETKPVFNGVLFENENNEINMVGTNTHRLAIMSGKITFNSEKNEKIIIPSRVLHEITRILDNDGQKDVIISWNRSKICFKINQFYVVSKLIEGQFPNYRNVIPKQYETIMTIHKSEFLEAVERASILAREDKLNVVKLTINGDTMIISSNTPEIGQVQEDIPIVLQGSDIQIAFNVRYIMDVLKIIENDQIFFGINSAITPAAIKPLGQDNYTYIITPVRLH